METGGRARRDTASLQRAPEWNTRHVRDWRQRILTSRASGAYVESNKTDSTRESTKDQGTSIPAKIAKTIKKKSATKHPKKIVKRQAGGQGNVAFPMHSIIKCLRIPQAILEQNAGKECLVKDAIKFAGLGYTGVLGVEVSSATKYGLLERPKPGFIKPTDLVRRIVRPQSSNDRLEALRKIVLTAPVLSDVYKNYRGENLPDHQFFINALVDTYKVPEDKAEAFSVIFHENLVEANLLERVGDKERVLDVTHSPDTDSELSDDHLKKISRGVAVQSTDTCFVMQPFAPPLGSYYINIYEPAIKKAGLTAVRADAEIFGTGKIIDQIWQGINRSRVLVAELTSRNANVFYELGLAHALKKPVVLISSNENDVPFDIRHVRVIYYDLTDPFWGSKLIDKVAENIISALKDPKDAILFE